MGLGFLTRRQQEAKRRAMQRIDRRLYLAADRRTLVEDGDPRAAFLWAGAGTEVDNPECERVGYKPDKGKAASSVARATDIDATPPDLTGGHDIVAPMTDAEREAEQLAEEDEADVDTKSEGKPADKARPKPADKMVGRPSDKGKGR
jgi:hypothetical protein